ncbi:MAG: hypothetical protein WAT39_10680, partial [Planctomycetota bacterium]
TLAAVLAGERRSTGAIDLGPYVGWLLMVLLLAEIAVRRLQVTLPVPRWLRRGAPAPVAPVPVAVAEVTVVPEAPADVAPTGDAPGGGLLDALSRAKRRSGQA